MRATTLALGAFFTVVQFYTSLAALSPTPPVGFVFASPSVALVLVAILVAATLWSLVRLLPEHARLDATSTAICAAWVGSAALSAVLGVDPTSSLQVVGMMVMAAIFHLAFVRFAREPGVVRGVIGAYIAVGTTATLAALVMFAFHRPAALWALNNGRAAGFFVTANEFAAFLIAFVFVASGVALGRRGIARTAGLAAVAIGCAALAATVSVAGWVGAAVGAIFFALALGARRVAILVAIVIVVGGAVFAIRPAARHNPAESFDRLRIWRSGLRVAELFPLTGVGPMGYFRIYPAIRPLNADLPGTFGALHPHDAYLSLAGETGAVGLVAFGYGWWRFARTMRSRLRACAKPDRVLGLGICAALVAVLVQGIFDTIGVVEMAFVWIPFSALALGCVAPHARSATATVAS